MNRRESLHSQRQRLLPRLGLSAMLLALLPLNAQQTPPNPAPQVPVTPTPAPSTLAPPDPAQPLPDAPRPAQSAPARTEPAKPDPCHAKKEPADASSTSPAASDAQPAAAPAGQETESHSCPAVIPIINMPISNIPLINWYARFLDGPKVKPMTPKEKAWLAFRNVADPFNGLTILGSSAIAVGLNSHSDYGPGMNGFARYVGVSYSQDMTAEFFGTFLVPSVVHQDPHYHRMPEASMKRRIAHAAYQVLWTQGDDGKSMPNYGNLVGFAIDDEIGNLYIPGRKTNVPSSFERYGIALATAPIDNYVSEFLPDLARHIHIQIVVIQHIIDQVAARDAASNAP